MSRVSGALWVMSRASKLKVPVLGLYAGHDDYVKPAAIDCMRAGLMRSGSGSEIVVFPNVDH